MAAFPDYAKILLNGFDEKPDFGVLRTETDGGISKQRPTRSLPIVRRNAQVLVSGLADKLAFDSWFRQDLNGGAGWFDWTDPLDETVKQARFVGGDLTWTSPGVAWIAQVQIETVG